MNGAELPVSGTLEVITGVIARARAGSVLPASTAAFLPDADGMPVCELMIEFRSKMPAVQPVAPGTAKALSTRIALPVVGLYGEPVMAPLPPGTASLRPVISLSVTGLPAVPIEQPAARGLPTLPLSFTRTATSSAAAPVSGLMVPVAGAVASTSALTIHRPLKLMAT